jgi:hypothetical protein
LPAAEAIDIFGIGKFPVHRDSAKSCRTEKNQA